MNSLAPEIISTLPGQAPANGSRHVSFQFLIRCIMAWHGIAPGVGVGEILGLVLSLPLSHQANGQKPISHGDVAYQIDNEADGFPS